MWQFQEWRNNHSPQYKAGGSKKLYHSILVAFFNEILLGEWFFKFSANIKQNLLKAWQIFHPCICPPQKFTPNLPWKCAKTQKERPVSQALFFRESCCVSFHPSSPIFTHLHITKHFYVPRKISLGNGLEVDVIEMPAHFMERWAYDSRHTSWVGWEVILVEGRNPANHLGCKQLCK